MALESGKYFTFFEIMFLKLGVLAKTTTALKKNYAGTAVQWWLKAEQRPRFWVWQLATSVAQNENVLPNLMIHTILTGSKAGFVAKAGNGWSFELQVLLRNFPKTLVASYPTTVLTMSHSVRKWFRFLIPRHYLRTKANLARGRVRV